MMNPWRVAALACAAVTIQLSPARGIDLVDPADTADSAGSVEGVSDVDIAIGRSNVTTPTAFVPKLLTSPLPATGFQDTDVTSRTSAVGGELLLLDETGEGLLDDVVAAARNDYDHEAEPDDDPGAPVNGWTGSLESDEPLLAPPPVRQAPREAAGRSPSGMGSQIVP
jgi:hypothetical protein